MDPQDFCICMACIQDQRELNILLHVKVFSMVVSGGSRRQVNGRLPAGLENSASKSDNM